MKYVSIIVSTLYHLSANKLNKPTHKLLLSRIVGSVLMHSLEVQTSDIGMFSFSSFTFL